MTSLRARLFALALGTAFAVPVAGHSAQVQAQAPDVASQISGSYGYVGGAKQKAKIEVAIDDATEDMFPGIRGIARSRLKDTNPATAKVKIDVSGGFIKIEQVGFRTVTAPASGVKIPWRTKQGDKVKASHKFKDGQLVQRLVSGEGGRENTYSLSADGSKLTVSVRIWSKRLPKDVKYKLSYARK